jgi:hypothetical protein
MNQILRTYSVSQSSYTSAVIYKGRLVDFKDGKKDAIDFCA